jgi:hypothetical protein
MIGDVCRRDVRARRGRAAGIGGAATARPASIDGLGTISSTLTPVEANAGTAVIAGLLSPLADRFDLRVRRLPIWSDDSRHSLIRDHARSHEGWPLPWRRPATQDQRPWRRSRQVNRESTERFKNVAMARPRYAQSGCVSGPDGGHGALITNFLKLDGDPTHVLRS